MKTAIVKIQKKIFLTIAAIAILLLSTNVIAASKDPDTSGKQVTVEYLGTMYGQPLFQLNVQNDALEDLTIILENADGEELYIQRSSDKLFSKKIRLATTETNISLNLRVHSRKTNKTQVYEINKITKQSDDLVISQVKY
ncbi:MAG: hypothetical protein QM737_07740 [Ferruginibacter sp.]